MNETSESPKKSYPAKVVEELASAGPLLSEENKHLAEIHPVVAGIVEADSDSDDFGRIKDVDVAQEAANYQAWRRESMQHVTNDERFLSEQSNEDTTRMVEGEIASELWRAYTSDDEVQKAVEDYRIIQGKDKAIANRFEATEKDVEKQQNGPSFLAKPLALIALTKASRAARKARKQSSN